MSEMIPWMAAEAERPIGEPEELPKRRTGPTAEELRGVGAHSFPGRGIDPSPGESQNPHFSQRTREMGHPETSENQNPYSYWDELRDDERERRIYRGRTVTMLRRYMRYSLETGRLPSLLGREFFRAKVTSYTVVTFEDRVIFVHDMEKCLEKLDEFSRQLIARHILQEHDQLATARLLNCAERTVRTYVPVVLDLLSEILIEAGLLERSESKRKKSCQGGENDEIPVSDCEEGENKF